MKKFFNIVLIIILLLVSAAAVLLVLKPRQASAPKTLEVSSDLDSYLKDITHRGMPPSVSLTVIKRGEIVYQKAHGMADSPSAIPADHETIYPWWSATKLFTSVAILQLVDRGYIDFSDPVSQFLPEFIPVNEEGDVVLITVEQLLNHSSGLPDIIPEGLTWIHSPMEGPVNQTEFFWERVAGKYDTVEFTPGTNVKYSNIGYILLGVIIESVTGRSYESYVTQEILEPLELNSTSFYRSPELQERCAQGSMAVIDIFTILMKIYGEKDFFDVYLRDRIDGRFWFKPIYTDYTPSTGLSGTSVDLARFGYYIMTGKTPEGDKPDILSTSLLKKMQVPYLLKELEKGYAKGEQFGYGLKVWKVGKTRIYGHGGGGPGYGTILAFDPVRQLVLAVSTNDTSFRRDEIVEAVMKINWENRN